ncbi:unnamed protein product [Adineta steineri]|uniref:Uncharacterized protein n=1 Tax=Adineta steineri TaxID=433720 RepID=A0A813Z315_9BILA|nr:unnamed protein product [Adineta steineri]CAF0892587.1 unnamed protein product [Adineta steineri]
MLDTMTKNNTTISISSNSVKFVVKCRDTNSFMANVNMDNSGAMTMDNNETTDENSKDFPIVIVFDKCRSRTNGLLSLFKSFSSDIPMNNSETKFSGLSFTKTFRMNISDDVQDESMQNNETSTLA